MQANNFYEAVLRDKAMQNGTVENVFFSCLWTFSSSIVEDYKDLKNI